MKTKRVTNCLLCDSKKLYLQEKIQTRSIIQSWEKQKISVGYLFENVVELDKMICKNCELVFFSPLIPGDNDFYSQLALQNWYYNHNDKTEFSFSNNYIEENDSILDIGSGRGTFKKHIKKNIDYTGLELSSNAVHLATKDNINVVEQTIESYSEKNLNKHDVAVAFQVLEHITNIESFIKSSIKAIKPLGFLIIAVPNNDSFIKDAFNNLLNSPPHHTIQWNEKSLTFLAKKYDLNVVEIYKEQVTKIHKDWYFSTTVNKFLRNILNLKTKSFNVNISDRIINKIASIISKLWVFKNSYKNKFGHTILIVMQKSKE